MIKEGSEAFDKHWLEYLMEATELTIFMLSACLFVALIELPSSPVRQAVDSMMMRHLLIGLSMGLTAIAIVYSPLGKRSGAHFNPAVTITFLRLGKIAPWDAFFYIVAQFIGGIFGVIVASFVLGRLWIADPNVNYVVTQPGILGVKWAFVAELCISFSLMLMVLLISNNKRLNGYTPLFVGVLITILITFEAPISGMSMNPARTLGSALPASVWTAIWIYFIAPPIGMLLAAETYLFLKGKRSVLCCKLHHENNQPCIFHCRYGEDAPKESIQDAAE